LRSRGVFSLTYMMITFHDLLGHDARGGEARKGAMAAIVSPTARSTLLLAPGVEAAHLVPHEIAQLALGDGVVHVDNIEVEVRRDGLVVHVM